MAIIPCSGKCSRA